MNEETAIITAPPQESRFLAPAASIQQAVDRFNMMGQFVKAVMKPDLDYGVIPGTGTKPTLYKPGAEKLTTLFGLSSRFILAESESDWTGKDHDGEPFFYFHYRAQIYSGERLVAEGEGSCNSWEKKYRYRQSDLVCPECGKPTLLKSKKDPGWFCWTKKGGCGANFAPNDQRISNQSRGPVKNPDAADLVNTIQKMAQKRAYVAAVLLATNASEFFTQDVEDFANYTDVIEGQFIDHGLVTSGTANRPAATGQQPKANGAKKPSNSQKLTVETAATTASKSGNSIAGEMTDDERKTAIASANGKKLSAEDAKFIDACKLLNTPASADFLLSYDQVREAAIAKGFEPAEAPTGISYGSLRQLLVGIEEMTAAEVQDA